MAVQTEVLFYDTATHISEIELTNLSHKYLDLSKLLAMLISRHIYQSENPLFKTKYCIVIVIKCTQETILSFCYNESQE